MSIPQFYIRRQSALVLMVIAIPLLAGCMERKEKIIVSEDGRVGIQIHHSTNSANEIKTGDAMPTRSRGWDVKEWDEADNDGETTYHLEAEQVFGAGADLPSTYARQNDAFEKAYLQFPTELTIERRRDGVYYHFYRRYEPRQYAQIGALKEATEEEVKKYVQANEDGGESQLVNLSQVASTLIEFEIQKMEILARAAFVDVSRNEAQDVWLNVHERLKELHESVDYQRLGKILEQAQEEENSELFESIAAELNEALHTAIEEALNESGFGRMAGFRNRLAFHEKAWEITEGLGNDMFTISVEMPGRIIASNANSVQGSTGQWEIPGPLMNDRQIEIMITSRIEAPGN